MKIGRQKHRLGGLAIVVWFLNAFLVATAFRIQNSPSKQIHPRRGQPLFSESSDSKSTNNPFGRQNIKYTSCELSNRSKDGEKSSQSTSLSTTDPLLLRRDRALLALHSSLGMDMVDAMNLLEAFPSLYNDCPSLSTRLLYLREELNLSTTKIKRLLSVHPSMMVKVLLDDPENNLPGTVELLQTELQLSLEEIVQKRLYALDRMELRPKLALFRRDLEMSTEDMTRMIRRSTAILVQDYDVVEDNVDFLIEGPVGLGLGSILRRGESTERVATVEKKREIVLQRVKELIIKYPEVGTADIRPAVEYLQSIGCDSMILGRIAYRRPQLLQYEVASLRENLQYFADNLGLPVGRNFTTSDHDSKSVIDLLAVIPDVFTQSLQQNLEPKFRYFRDQLGFSRAELQSVFVGRPQILALSLENNIIPKLKYLRIPASEGGAGVTAEGLRSLLVNCPQSLREPLDDRIKKRCSAVVAAGHSIPDGLPPNFLTVTDRMWEPWVEAGFDESKLEEAKTTLKRRRAKK